jgi:hypothetical protein
MMWAIFRRVLGRSKNLSAVFGEVIFETPEVSGQRASSFLQWRIKQGLDGKRYLIGFRMKADAYAGAEGSPTNYMNFDIESAQRLRDQLDRCIGEYYRLQGTPHERR